MRDVEDETASDPSQPVCTGAGNNSFSQLAGTAGGYVGGTADFVACK